MHYSDLEGMRERLESLEKRVSELEKQPKRKPSKPIKAVNDIPEGFFVHDGMDFYNGYIALRKVWATNRQGSFIDGAKEWMALVKKGFADQAYESASSYIKSEMERGGNWYQYIPLLPKWLQEGRYL